MARNILVLSYDYQGEESCLKSMEEKGSAPGDYISNLYKNNPEGFKKLVKTEMDQDFGWDNKPAKRYMELFHQMLGR